jgi:hypothetical protein
MAMSSAAINSVTIARPATREVHRLADDVLHLTAGLPEQMPDADQQIPGDFVGHRLDAELRITVQQSVVHVTEQHGVTAETIGRGQPALSAPEEPLAIGYHALDQHQLAGRRAQLVRLLLGGGHGGHQLVAGHQHAGGDGLEASERPLQLLLGGLTGGDGLELAAEVRPLLVELREARLDLRGGRPQAQGRARRVQILQQPPGIAMPFPQELQGHVRIAGCEGGHACHLQCEEYLLFQAREERRVVRGPVLLV